MYTSFVLVVGVMVTAIHRISSSTRAVVPVPVICLVISNLIIFEP